MDHQTVEVCCSVSVLVQHQHDGKKGASPAATYPTSETDVDRRDAAPTVRALHSGPEEISDRCDAAPIVRALDSEPEEISDRRDAAPIVCALDSEPEEISDRRDAAPIVRALESGPEEISDRRDAAPTVRALDSEPEEISDSNERAQNAGDPDDCCEEAEGREQVSNKVTHASHIASLSVLQSAAIWREGGATCPLCDQAASRSHFKTKHLLNAVHSPDYNIWVAVCLKKKCVSSKGRFNGHYHCTCGAIVQRKRVDKHHWNIIVFGFDYKICSTMNGAMEPEVLTEIPESLKRLVRYIVRGFYSVEHALVLDLLVHHPCVKEDDILELLFFERKQLRALINTLRNDKFLKVRMKMETDADGRTSRHNYYFINYSTFVNVVKYKMDHMRRKIETEERDSTHRASFICPKCSKTYTDLEVGKLVDFLTGQLFCDFCHTEVKEEESVETRRDSRSLMETFNMQMAPIDKLLLEVEDVKLSQELLEPEPIDIKSIRPREGGSSRGHGEKTTWSGDATKNKAYGYVNVEDKVVISMDGEQGADAREKPTLKETPIWMSQSTVEGAASEPFLQDRFISQPGPSDLAAARSQSSEDIMRTLLAHEKKSAANIPSAPGPSHREDTSSSESEDEIPTARPVFTTDTAEVMQESNDEDEEEEALVSIGNLRVPFNEVTEEMTERMTPAEKEAYIRLGQEMYQDMYD